MSKYIYHFQTKEEHDNAIENNYVEPWVSYTEENKKLDYNKKSYNCFTIEASSNGTNVFFRQSAYSVGAGMPALKVQVSIDGGNTWTEKTASAAEDGVPGTNLAELDAGEKLLIKGNNPVYGYYDSEQTEISKYCDFWADKYCYVYGNIMSLVGGDNYATIHSINEYAFAYFFAGPNTWVLLKDDEALYLPATLGNYCYYGMFYGCTGLTTTPVLPATLLFERCYAYMFSGCTSLTSTPELPATLLANGCYEGMFKDCTGLTSAPALPATILGHECYRQMFKNCTGLTSAPKLPATTLKAGCYESMFNGCTSLTSVPKLPATKLMSSCYQGMFSGCTGITSAPELPAITLVNSCYAAMFYYCRNLNYVKALFTNTPSSGYTNGWLNGVSSTGTFVKNSSATWNVAGANGIPSGWTVETADA